MRILLIDNDEVFSNQIKANLIEQRYTVDTAANGIEGLDLVEVTDYDLIILDVVLPKLDGINFCRRLRLKGKQVLVLLLTARGTSDDKVMGLNAGADDYVVKPVSLSELDARIRALLRRKATSVSPILEWGNLRFDSSIGEVTYGSVTLNLTAKEYALLQLFMSHTQKVHSSSSILNQLWSLSDEPPTLETLRTLIKRLRQKLKAVGATDLIENVYGLGYRLNPAFQKAVSLSDRQPLAHATVTECSQPGETKTWLLIVDEEQEFIDSLVKEATVKGLQTALAPNPKLALDAIGRVRPDIVLLDMKSANTTDGLLLLDELCKQTPPIPVLVFTSNDSTTDRVALARRQCRGFFTKPIAPTRVLEALAQTLKPVKTQQLNVMVLDDDKLTLRLVQTLLEPWGLNVTTLSNPLQFWHELEAVTPDLLILDVQMPDINGVELCQILRNDSRWASLPILFLTGQRNAEIIQQVFAAGADDYVSKPVVACELITRIFNRLERTRLLREQAEVDLLTGLPNRHRSTQDLNRLLHLAHLYQQPFCLAVLTLDHLTQVNRNYGHQLGDQMLRRLAHLLRQELRSEDIVSKWDGAEFVVGMYGITRGDGVEWLAEILELVSLDAPPIHITFSAGVTQYPEDGKNIQELYQTAGAILEKARECGGDRVYSVETRSNGVPWDVLLLHQDSPFATTILRALEIRGYHARWIPDGKTALEVLGEPSLYSRVILLEEDLPNGNGIDILKHFQRDQITQRSRVVWLSTGSRSVEQALNLGCFDYINLPCNISAFMHRLRQTL